MTSPASSRTLRCFITPNRVISSSDSSSVNVRPSRWKSRSSRKRRVGSASALNTRSSSVTPAGYVTFWSHVKGHRPPRSAQIGPLGTEGLAGLDKRLQPAEHPAPSAATAFVLHRARCQERDGRGTRELVGQREPGHPESPARAL